MGDFEIYKAISKLFKSFLELSPKEKIDYKGKKLVSVCGRCKDKFFKCSKKKGERLARRTKKDPMHCAICKRKLAPPYMRSKGNITLKEK